MAQPPQDKFSHIPFGPQRCRNVGGQVLDALVAAIRATADRNGGTLTMDDVEQAVAKVRASPRGLWNFYRDSFAGCFHASHAVQAEGYERNDLFVRLLTLTFEARFPENVSPDDDGPILSRSVVAPFAFALEMMLGQDDLAAYETACNETYDELLRLHGDQLTWQAFYDADGSQRVLGAVCVAVARYFSDFDSHKKWFIDVLNRHKAETAHSPEGNGEAEFTETDFALLFTCLFSRCRHATNDAAISALADRIDAYGLGKFAGHGAP